MVVMKCYRLKITFKDPIGVEKTYKSPRVYLFAPWLIGPFSKSVSTFQAKCELLFSCSETQYPPETWEVSTEYLEYNIRPFDDLIARIRSFFRFGM